MRKLHFIGLAVLAAAVAAIIAACASEPTGGSSAGDISGTVTSSSGPEAGVWVIAETTDLPTKYAKVVVTDDGGRDRLAARPSATRCASRRCSTNVRLNPFYARFSRLSRD